MARFDLRQAQVWRDQLDQALNVNWANQHGDWFDSSYVAQGASPFASVSVLDTNTAREVVIDITAMAQNWYLEPDRSTFVFLMGALSGNIEVALLADADPMHRPRISYNAGADQVATDNVVLSSGSAGGLTATPSNVNGSLASPPWSRWVIEFPAPVAPLASAEIKFWTSAQYGGQTIQVFQGRAPGEVGPPVAPGAPTNARVTALGATTATLECDAPSGGGAVTGYEFYYRAVGQVAWVTVPSAGPLVNLTLLSSASNYEFDVAAVGVNSQPGPLAGVESFWTANAVTGGGQIVPVLVIDTAGLPASVVITDEDAVAVDGATVVAQPGAIGLGTSGVNGIVSVSGLAAGNYALTAAKGSGIGAVNIRVEGGPVITSPPTFSLPEETLLVGSVVATDPNSDAVTFSIVGGIDQASFEINAVTGALSFIGLKLWASPDDANHNSVYLVRVRATANGDFSEQDIAVTVLQPATVAQIVVAATLTVGSIVTVTALDAQGSPVEGAALYANCGVFNGVTNAQGQTQLQVGAAVGTFRIWSD